MPKDDLIALGLRGRTPQAATQSAASKPLPGTTLSHSLDALLHLLGDLVLATDLREAQSIGAQIGQTRALLCASPDDASIAKSVAAVCEACQRAIADADRMRGDQKEEIARLVAMVHEALAIVAGDGQTFAAQLDGSMERFETIAKLDNLQQLKQRLTSEVMALRQMAAERRRQWEVTAAHLQGKVQTLQRQLTVTKEEASLDPLTQVLNRGAFDRTLQEWLAAGKMDFVVGIVDVDHFKTINDTHGHAVGDEALVTVARNLARSVRTGSDVVGRIGGDEFAALIAGIPLRQAEARLRLVGSTLASVPTMALGKTLRLTLSIGVAECSAGDTLESLKQRADAALYEAKHLGRNRVVSKEKPTVRELRAR